MISSDRSMRAFTRTIVRSDPWHRAWSSGCVYCKHLPDQRHRTVQLHLSNRWKNGSKPCWERDKRLPLTSNSIFFWMNSSAVYWVFVTTIELSLIRCMFSFLDWRRLRTCCLYWIRSVELLQRDEGKIQMLGRRSGSRNVHLQKTEQEKLFSGYVRVAGASEVDRVSKEIRVKSTKKSRLSMRRRVIKQGPEERRAFDRPSHRWKPFNRP